jgi:glycolate oxidase iron-sulfur subunit
VEALLTSLGYQVQAFDEQHLCCGSAGTYSITQKSLSMQLRDRKLGHISASKPELIVTANIGCQTHLQAGTDTPVRHWLELISS